jgi:hypothetical protein
VAEGFYGEDGQSDGQCHEYRHQDVPEYFAKVIPLRERESHSGQAVPSSGKRHPAAEASAFSQNHLPSGHTPPAKASPAIDNAPKTLVLVRSFTESRCPARE